MRHLFHPRRQGPAAAWLSSMQRRWSLAGRYGAARLDAPPPARGVGIACLTASVASPLHSRGDWAWRNGGKKRRIVVG